MNRLLWVAFLGCVAAVTPAQAQGKRKVSGLYSARDLVQDCRAAIVEYDSSTAPVAADGLHCLGYVQGFTETSLMWQVADQKSTDYKAPLFCLTPKATNEVIIRRVPIWAIEHAPGSTDTAIELLLDMLVASYPCPK